MCIAQTSYVIVITYTTFKCSFPIHRFLLSRTMEMFDCCVFAIYIVCLWLVEKERKLLWYPGWLVIHLLFLFMYELDYLSPEYNLSNLSAFSIHCFIYGTLQLHCF